MVAGKTPRQIWQRAIEVLRTEGWCSLWFKLWGEILYRRVVIVERSLDEPLPPVEARLPVTLGLLQESEVDEYVAFRPEAEPAEIRRRLQAGQLCFVARHEGRLVQIAWAAIGRARIDYLAREVALAPDQAYCYESFTAPDVRGQNIAAARSVFMQQVLRQADYRRLVAVIMPENKRAFRPAEKAGYRRVGMLRTFWLGPWRWHFGRFTTHQPESLGLAYWDGVARQLDADAHYLDAFLGELKRQVHLALLERWGGVSANGRLLKTDLFEEAMGPDAFLTNLAGRPVVGMDLSPVIAGRARQRDTGCRACYVAADVRRLPFADGTFALIVSPSTLDHFADPADLGRSLRELARVLAPGGRLIVTLDNRQNIFDPLLRLAGRLRLVPYYLGTSYTVSELRAELAAAGLVVLETTAILHNPRLVATGAVAVVNRLGWPPLIRAVRRALLKAQRWEGRWWQYRTGSFVAALAVHRPFSRDDDGQVKA